MNNRIRELEDGIRRVKRIICSFEMLEGICCPPDADEFDYLEGLYVHLAMDLSALKKKIKSELRNEEDKFKDSLLHILAA